MTASGFSRRSSARVAFMKALLPGSWKVSQTTITKSPNWYSRNANSASSRAAAATLSLDIRRAMRSVSRHLGAQLRQHGGGVGPHAVPDEEGLGGLFDQHAQAVGHTVRAGGLGLQQEGRGPGAVHHVVGQAAGRIGYAGDGRRLARQAAGRGVDDDVPFPLGLIQA